MGLPPEETCKECGKTISGRARANIFNDRIVCTNCYNKLEGDRQGAEAPATSAQLRYAESLGLAFPPEIKKWEMSALISRHVDDGETEPASSWLLILARQLGLSVTDYHGARAVYRWIHNSLKSRADRTALAEWFVWHVARERRGGGLADPRSCGVPVDAMRAVADQIATEPKAIGSIERYDGDALIAFGESVDAEGWTKSGGSKRTMGYQRAAELLRSAGY